MLNCRTAKGAKATQCMRQGGSHPNAPRGVLPGALRHSSPSWLPGPTCCNRINPSLKAGKKSVAFIPLQLCTPWKSWYMKGLWTAYKTADCTQVTVLPPPRWGEPCRDRPWPHSIWAPTGPGRHPRHISQPLRVMGALRDVGWAWSCTLPSLPLFNQEPR